MKNIIVHVGDNDYKAAIIEDERLAEYYIEKPSKELVGNIYIGKVVNVLPGMQAAFIDIGIGKNAFLYVNDAIPFYEDVEIQPSIKEILKEGQKIIVQVQKEPFGNKGPRVTTHISLPGRYLVYMPNVNYVGISRRIVDEDERNRLKEFGESIKNENEGLIIRTVASEASNEQMIKDLNFLKNLWKTISEQSKQGVIPSLIYKDLDLIPRLIRDVFTEEVNQFVLDSGYEYKRVKELVQLSSPELVDRFHHYAGREHIFDVYNIQIEIDKATKRKVWLKSGGYIIIDKTEALTSIDVNTGKYIGQSTLEETVLKTNLEAAVEIARQLRLRDIGGIIIIDFIDMEKEENGKKVLDILEEEMKKDRTKSNVLGLTQLGLVEMTRKKVRQSLDSTILKPCPVCDGLGRVISEEELISKIEREIIHYREHNSVHSLTIDVHPHILTYLKANDGEKIKHLEKISDKKINIKGDETIQYNQYSVHFEI